MNALIDVGLSKSARKTKMRCSGIQQIATTVYAHSAFVKDEDIKHEAINALGRLRKRMVEHAGYYDKNDAIRSSFDFLKKVFEIVG